MADSLGMPTSAPNSRGRVLILDEDRIVLHSLAALLRRDGYDVATTDNLPQARQKMDDHAIDVLLADLQLAGEKPGLVLRDLRRNFPNTAVIVHTAYGSIEAAVEATRLGAADYLTKPIVDEIVCQSVKKAIEDKTLRGGEPKRSAAAGDRDGLENLIGRDMAMQRVYDLVDAVAGIRTTVLIIGESGTGKSVLARAIHRKSPRRAKPFIEIACGSLPDSLLESELFGHVKGSFTGATQDKPGRFVAADTGSIFLDEINSAPPHMQVKLLRVLQERQLEAVGSDATRSVDVRAIMATNADLAAMVAAGTFRQDLYYRINVIPITLPPLRQRMGDVPLLAEHFVKHFSKEAGRQVIGLTPAAHRRLLDHDWPGNVRELENAIERAVVLCGRPMIDADDLPAAAARAAAKPQADGDSIRLPTSPMTLEKALELPERSILLAALRRNQWNRQATADALGINRTTLYKKMRKYDLDGPTASAEAAA